MHELSNEPRLLIDRRDAAYQLGISVRKLDELIALNEISVRRIGRRVLVPRRSLEEFLRSDHQ
jgi:excisionase family DNA binding protein